jgi:hypothetical protein
MMQNKPFAKIEFEGLKRESKEDLDRLAPMDFIAKTKILNKSMGVLNQSLSNFSKQLKDDEELNERKMN